MAGTEANAALSAALKGATLAFNGQKTDTDRPKPKPKPKPKPVPEPRNSNARDSGALQAATEASRDHSISSAPRSPTSPSGRRNKNPLSRGLSRQATGGSVQDLGSPGYSRELEHGAVSRKLSQYLGSSPASPRLLSPGGRPGSDHRSASFIAATLAASRSASPSPHHTGQAYGGHTPQPAHSPLNPNMMRRRSIGASSVNSLSLGLDPPDTSSIPPTNSLISMFEQQKDDTDPVKKRDLSPEHAKVGPRPKLRTLTPPRSLSPPVQVHSQDRDRGNKQGDDKPRQRSQSRPKPAAPPLQRARTPPQIVRRAATEILSPEPRRLGPKPNLQPPAVPPQAAAESLGTVTKRSAKPPAQKPNASTLDARLGPARPQTGRLESEESTLTRRTSTSSASSDDTFVSASSTRSPRPTSPVRGREGPAASSEALSRIKTSSRPILSPPKPSTVKRASSMHNNPSGLRNPIRRPGPITASTYDTTNTSTSTLPLDSLTSAIMAGNLAANRHLPSPSEPPPVPAPRRPGHHKHLHPNSYSNGGGGHGAKKHHTGGSTTSNSKSRSPQRPSGGTHLLTTLRQPATPSDEEDGVSARHKRRRKPLSRGKKHAHHEGARKRWRDEVSARERKRYEAVWASNRGLFVGDGEGGGGEDLVADVVVRDIWSRSRLPFDELAEVWDLVYRGRNGALNREEFVVGMWIIDQRLRGRKIPARVSDSVWDSARGMRVKAPKGKK